MITRRGRPDCGVEGWAPALSWLDDTAHFEVAQRERLVLPTLEVELRPVDGQRYGLRSSATTTVAMPSTRLTAISLRMRSMDAAAVLRSVVRRKRA